MGGGGLLIKWKNPLLFSLVVVLCYVEFWLDYTRQPKGGIVSVYYDNNIVTCSVWNCLPEVYIS